MSAAERKYVVMVEGMDDINFADASEKISRAASMAINATADFSRKDGADEIRRRFNYPGNYVDSDGRLVVSKYAKTSNLEAMVTGRRRATSLARFMVQNNGINHAGVVVEMLKGKPVNLDKAFPVKLRSGKEGPLSNVGLAVRVKGIAAPKRALKPVMLSVAKNGASSVWLLYGMSVNQAFIAAKELTAPRAEVFLESEASRLMGVAGL